MKPDQTLTVAIAGLGAVGRPIAEKLDTGIPGLRLTAVSAKNLERAREKVSAFRTPVAVVAPEDLAAQGDVVVECAPAAVFDRIATPAVEAGRIFVPISIGMLLQRPQLIERAAETGARILAPTGALIGLDAVRAAAEGRIEAVKMVTRKPPAGLAGAPYLIENAIDVTGLTEPLKVFEGTAREGARGFPANVNVAAALGLAGIGADRTRLEIWADPSIRRNTHHIEVEADSARFSMTIENVPSDDNPATGRITALSVIAQLRRLTAPLTVGT